MTKCDLVTGFLGAGKTTFLKRYARYLMGRGEKIGILVNDYGAVSIDRALLLEELGGQCDIEMVVSGDADCRRRRFKTKLIAFGMDPVPYDRVIVEPSGVYDVDEFFDVLYEEPVNRWFEPGAVTALVDARLPESLSEESDYIICSQISAASSVIFSHMDEATEEELSRTIAHINRAMQRWGCMRTLSRQDSFLYARTWEQYTDADFAQIASAERVGFDHEKLFLQEGQGGFGCLFFFERLRGSEVQIREKITSIIRNPKCGNVIRVKGYVPRDGAFLEINGMAGNISIKPSETGQDVLIVVGEQLSGEEIETELEAEIEI